MMKKEYSQQELEMLIPDYLNGYSSTEERIAIEAAMANDHEIRQTIEFEKMAIHSMKGQQQRSNAQPSFDSIRDKVEGKGRWSPFNFSGWSVSAAFSLLLVVGFGSWLQQQSLTNNDFETLSNPSISYGAQTLRIIGIESATDEELRKLLAAHELQLIQHYPSYNVYDVTLEKNQINEQLVELISNDKLVRSVRIVESSQ